MGKGRIIYQKGRREGWYQGQVYKAIYHGEGILKRGNLTSWNPVTVPRMIETGTWNENLREGRFVFENEKKEKAILEFEQNVFIRIVENPSGSEIFEEMMKQTQIK